MTDSVNGHLSEDELQRLDAQGAFLRPSTQDFLKRVGITSGMRVLNVGCGVGDVAFLAAEMVGPSGEIIGVDRDEALTSTAAKRSRAKGISNVRFLHCEVDRLAEALAPHCPFDAVVSRLGIIHHPKPAEAVRSVLRMVRPDGLVGLQEIDLAARYWSTHKLGTLEQLYNWIDELAGKSGKADLSSALVKAFADAGIVQRRIIRSGAIESSTNAGIYAWVGNFARMLIGAVAGEGDLPDFGKSFESRLQSEVESKGAVFIPFHFIGAAGRLPPAASPQGEKS